MNINMQYKEVKNKSCRVMGGENTGKLFNAVLTDGGIMPRYMPVYTGYTPLIYTVSGGFAASDGTIFLVSGLALYCKPAGERVFSVIAEGLARTPFFVENSNCVFISDGVTNYTYADGALTSQSAVVGLYGGVIHYSRLFGVDLEDGYTVRWSSPDTLDDWTEGLRCSGWLKLPPERGKILKLIPYDDKLIAVRENGLTVIKAYGETENFRVASSDTQTDRIIDGTAAVCAGKLFFATYSGEYSFDGSDIQRECEGLDGLGRVILAAACGNFYFASVYLDGDVALACVDGESGEVSFCDIYADCIFSCGDIYVAAGGKLYKLYYPAYNIVYSSGYTNFGEHGKKYLKYIFIDAEEECDVTVKSNGVSRIFEGVSGKFNVKMSGDTFLITVTAVTPVYYLDAYYCC